MKIRLRFFVLALAVIGMLSLVPTTKVEAASKDVKISKTNFPDKNFREFVKRKFDKNKDNKLSAKEIKAVTKISICSDYEQGDLFYIVGKIKSIKGIRFFTYLKSLRVWQETIEGFSLQNTSLEKIDLSTSDLSKYRFHRCKNLKIIRIRSLNSINIDFSKFEQVKELEIHVNGESEYETLHIEECKNLEKLVLVNNICTDSIDLNKFEKLKEFRYSGKINRIYAKGHESLEQIQCVESGLTGIEVQDCKNLKYLGLALNPLTTIDVTTNRQLRLINVDYTDITELDLSQNPNIGSVYIKNSKISVIDLSNNKKVKCVLADENQKIVGWEKE